MQAAVWHGRQDVRTERVDDPTIEAPTDAIVRITSTGLCGSDLHLYPVMTPFMTPGDVLGHEPMGIVEAIGSDITNLSIGDRVVVPFDISCGKCFMCARGLQSQCETTQVHEHDTGAALFGYTKLYGQVPGGQAELLRVPHADYGPIVVPPDPPDDRFLFLSDVLPTAWQAVQYAAVPPDGTVVVLGLGPIGDMSSPAGTPIDNRASSKGWKNRIGVLTARPTHRDSRNRPSLSTCRTARTHLGRTGLMRFLRPATQ